MALILFAFRAEVPVSDELRTAVPSIGETIIVPQPPLLLFFVAWLAGFATIILSIVWLARRGQTGPNKFVPDPMEATT